MTYHVLYRHDGTTHLGAITADSIDAALTEANLFHGADNIVCVMPDTDTHGEAEQRKFTKTLLNTLNEELPGLHEALTAITGPLVGIPRQNLPHVAYIAAWITDQNLPRKRAPATEPGDIAVNPNAKPVRPVYSDLRAWITNTAKILQGRGYSDSVRSLIKRYGALNLKGLDDEQLEDVKDDLNRLLGEARLNEHMYEH